MREKTAPDFVCRLIWGSASFRPTGKPATFGRKDASRGTTFCLFVHFTRIIFKITGAVLSAFLCPATPIRLSSVDLRHPSWRILTGPSSLLEKTKIIFNTLYLIETFLFDQIDFFPWHPPGHRRIQVHRTAKPRSTYLTGRNKLLRGGDDPLSLFRAVLIAKNILSLNQIPSTHGFFFQPARLSAPGLMYSHRS